MRYARAPGLRSLFVGLFILVLVLMISGYVVSEFMEGGSTLGVPVGNTAMSSPAQTPVIQTMVRMALLAALIPIVLVLSANRQFISHIFVSVRTGLEKFFGQTIQRFLAEMVAVVVTLGRVSRIANLKNGIRSWMPASQHVATAMHRTDENTSTLASGFYNRLMRLARQYFRALQTRLSWVSFRPVNLDRRSPLLA